jgi:HAD superfamily hydrolase (TIGR01509 family)
MNLGVLFDMDGVLTDNLPLHLEAWKIFARIHGLTVRTEDFREKLFGRSNPDILKFLYQRELPPSEGERLAWEKEELYRTRFGGEIRPVAGLIPFLAGLKENGARLAVATSGPPENLDCTVDRLGVRKFFDVLLDESHVRELKPSPEVYLKGADLLGILPDRCVVIEDSRVGVQAALAAGMKVVGLTTSYSAKELKNTHLTVGDFRELDFAKIASLLNHRPIQS